MSLQQLRRMNCPSLNRRNQLVKKLAKNDLLILTKQVIPRLFFDSIPSNKRHKRWDRFRHRRNADTVSSHLLPAYPAYVLSIF
jgi:hypothetical protein